MQEFRDDEDGAGRAERKTKTMTDAAHGRHSFGIACWQGAAGRMTIAHRHDDLEFNLADVDLDYLVDGRPLAIPAGRLAVFWAARPHQLVSDTTGHAVTWLTVPLERFLGWRTQRRFVESMLAGEFVLLDVGGARDADAGGANGDGRPLALDERVPGWHSELAGDDDERRTATLEIEAFTRRAARAASAEPGSSAAAASVIRPDAAKMAAWISEHAHEDVRVDDVARQVHLHPQYAMTVFRAALGITMGEYLAQCRVAHAQHLLLTSDLPVSDVGIAAGFRSQSQFYARFRQRCGEPPAAYRRRLGASAR
ncbi:helix-turn-helix domain-containing protein [Agromyces humatus]|uniref:Helix-turn-helix domain-containing protein n=1 Tax=Agromyces humatus TaxID=279573 RepID=A0ABN2KSF2_9MICO|nr:helix-turn-helix domain-containing protein [Agromyces humatus]